MTGIARERERAREREKEKERSRARARARESERASERENIRSKLYRLVATQHVTQGGGGERESSGRYEQGVSDGRAAALVVLAFY